MAFLAMAVLAMPHRAFPQTGDRALLQLIVNEVNKGEVLAVRRPDDVLIRLADLEAAGVRSTDGRREVIGKETYLSLSSLAPATTYELDEKNLTIRLTGQAGLQGTTRLNLAPGAPPGTIYSQDTSFFLNYAASTKGFNQYDVFGEAGLSVAGHLLLSTIRRTEDGQIVRGLSNVTLNDRDNLTRWTIGDSFANNAGLGGSAFLAGVSLAKTFSLDPYYYFFPRPGLSGTALVPSTVSVYSDGGLMRRETVNPGQFDLHNLPVSNGYRMNRVVVRDIFGRETEILSPFYLSTRVLSSGVSEYSFNAGMRRDNVGTASWDYDSPVMLARYRVGVTDSITPGTNVEVGDGLANGGFRLTAKSLWGEIDLLAAGSSESGAAGAAASVLYNYVQRWFSIGGGFRTMTDRYATVSLLSSIDRPTIESTGFIGIPIGTRINVTVEGTYSEFRDAGIVTRIGTSGTVRLADNWTLFFSGSETERSNSRTTYDGFIGLSYYFGGNTTGYVFAQRQQGRTFERDLGGVRVQKSLPVGPGYGYQVEGTGGTDAHGLGQFQYQGQYGRAEALYDSAVKQPVFTVSGGVVAVGGSVHATRAIQDSFAVIRTPGVSGMRGYINNQEVGTTDRRGELVVPSQMLSYYGNRVGINDRDVPLNYRVDATEKTVAPPFRGGALVEFPILRVQMLTGTLSVESDTRIQVPAYGQLAVTAKGTTHESPIGKHGEFYLENIPPGEHDAMISHEGQVCRFSLTIPDSPDPILKLGELHCRLAAGVQP
ncbi:MAG: fimbrial biogenesis outer membrane usher protein [Nitrospira sp.]|nr:fimbrial biogenesis outer membrane usher protein [Nitrospira sp.]